MFEFILGFVLGAVLIKRPEFVTFAIDYVKNKFFTPAA